jgi:hypothetical protein
MKQKTIKFIASSKSSYNVFDKPIPASKIIPEWYKKTNKNIGNVFSVGDNGNPSETIKACMPVFDIMTAGYFITMPADAFFEKIGEDYKVAWSTDLLSLIESHPTAQYENLKIPDQYNNQVYKFVQPWIIKTPPGYSCLFVSPTYRNDLPFYTFPSIVDTDKHPVPVNFPFFLNKNFSGIIEHGTPIVQVIPFKRDSWNSESLFDQSMKHQDEWQRAKIKISNKYKTFFRTVKTWK